MKESTHKNGMLIAGFAMLLGIVANNVLGFYRQDYHITGNVYEDHTSLGIVARNGFASAALVAGILFGLGNPKGWRRSNAMAILSLFVFLFNMLMSIAVFVYLMGRWISCQYGPFTDSYCSIETTTLLALWIVNIVVMVLSVIQFFLFFARFATMSEEEPASQRLLPSGAKIRRPSATSVAGYIMIGATVLIALCAISYMVLAWIYIVSDHFNGEMYGDDATAIAILAKAPYAGAAVIVGFACYTGSIKNNVTFTNIFCAIALIANIATTVYTMIYYCGRFADCNDEPSPMPLDCPIEWSPLLGLLIVTCVHIPAAVLQLIVFLWKTARKNSQIVSSYVRPKAVKGQ